jgi:archaemetzincin
VSTLGLLPLGAPPPPGAVLDRLATTLRAAFGLRVETRSALDEPAGAFDPSRGQWSAVAFLRALLDQACAGPGRLLGVTERDLFVPVLSFVYGQAQLRGRVAVLSLARLRAEYHGLPPDPELLARRAAVEAVHEVGHTLGLVHCLDRRCPMALSLGLEDLDLKEAAPCPSCAALLGGGPSAPGRLEHSLSAGGTP